MRERERERKRHSELFISRAFLDATKSSEELIEPSSKAIHTEVKCSNEDAKSGDGRKGKNTQVGTSPEREGEEKQSGVAAPHDPIKQRRANTEPSTRWE